MARWCAVPYCKTGSRTEQIKRSLFGVPKDPVIWKKWDEAIPGIVKLRQTDVICDKHFEEKDISREWIKLDTNDQVIARMSKMKKFHIGFKRVLTQIMYFFIKSHIQVSAT
ncbi:hypothetical protein ACS0PU_009107 [Formica fusca]